MLLRSASDKCNYSGIYSTTYISTMLENQRRTFDSIDATKL